MGVVMSRAIAVVALLAACGQQVEHVTSQVPTRAKSLVVPEAEASEPEMADDELLASWSGGQVTYADLNERVSGELNAMDVQYRLQRYETQAQALEVLVMERLLEAEAKRLGLSDVNALLVEEIEKKVSEPTPQEVEAFYPVAKRQLRGATLDEARPFLEQELLRRAQADRYNDYVTQLRTTSGVNVNFPYPELPRVEIPIAEHDPIRGSVNAPVTIVQFAEYQCYYCNRVSPTLDQLLETYEGKVRVVFKDFPLSNHGRAVPAAVAAHCSGEQDKYWEMNRVMLGNQQALADADLSRYARDLDLDIDRFQDCLASGRYESTIEADMEIGQEIGVEATPTFFVNGILVAGAQPYERFASLVERELEG
jgi:protein-disulfide isomerase